MTDPTQRTTAGPTDASAPPRTLIVVDPAACGIDAVERAIAASDPAASDIRTVVLAPSRAPDDVERARHVLVEATRIGQRLGFAESGWTVVRSPGELAHELRHAPTFDRAALVVPPRQRRSRRLRRVLRRGRVESQSACPA